MHPGLSSEKADEEREDKTLRRWTKNNTWMERKRCEEWKTLAVCHTHPSHSLRCENDDYWAAARGLGPFPAGGVGFGFLLLLVLVEKLWGRVWSSKGWKKPRSKFQYRRIQVLWTATDRNSLSIFLWVERFLFSWYVSVNLSNILCGIYWES